MLSDQTDRSPQGTQIPFADVNTINQNRTSTDIIKTRDEVHEGGLARACSSDQPNRLSRLNDEVEIRQYPFSLFPNARS